MKTLTTQLITNPSRWSRKLLPALFAALLSLCGATAGAQTWTIGTGTSYYSQISTLPAPLGYYNPTSHIQYMYKASELVAAGMTSGNIHQIAFNVATVQSSIGAPGYTLSLGAVASTITTLPTTGFLGGMTALFASGGYGATVGWNNIPFNTGPGVFNWNGTDNIVVDICYSTGATGVGPGNAGVYYTAATGLSTYYTGNTSSNYCNTTGLSPLSTTTNRPNIRFTRLTGCTGIPVAGTLSPSGTTTVTCPGTQFTIAANSSTNALGITYQWWSSTTGATGSWTAISGATSNRYTTPPLISTMYYHVVLTCANSGQLSADTTVNTVFNYTGGYPVYASLPYFESFESWSNGCANSDKISSNNWTNTPSTGNASWRREDQGSTASWTCPTCVTPPPPKDGAHTARWGAGYYAPVGAAGEGNLSLYVNASASAGAKDVEFWYRFNYAFAGAGDSMNVDMSIDGGATFAPLAGGQFGPGNSVLGAWNFVQIQNIVVNSPTTVFRFRAKHAAMYYDDIYLDAVRVLPPCTSTPTAGTINPVIACSGQPFSLSLTGNSQAAGLTYQWEYLPAGATVWQPLPGGTIPSPTTTITTNTQFRAIITCNNTIPVTSDTTPVYSAVLASFYYCYCSATGNPSSGPNYIAIGNVTITKQPSGVTILNNGNPLPVLNNPNLANNLGYEDFRTTVPAPTLIQDSLYRIYETQVTTQTFFQTGAFAGAWLDSNRDGIFQSTERLFIRSVPSQTNNTVSDTFRIRRDGPVGITGLRALIQYYNNPFNPCGLTYITPYGQYEDYLVNIEYQPCNGPVNPGIAYISDTAVCPGYTVDMFDTSYEHQRTNIDRMWEVSTNGGASFSAIPGSAQKDTLLNVTLTAASKYRLRVICNRTGDTTFSNVMTVSAPIPVRCYPVSWASLGAADSSDIGTVILGNSRFVFTNPVTGAGPHLGNPVARKRRTDYTLLTPVELNADSTYRLAIFHTMPRSIHSDALISVFIDYNNDMKYDLNVSGPPFTSELLYQGVTSAGRFFLDTMVKMPSNVIPNVLTGMRVVLNNDTDPLGSGNTGVGNFGSGEVEDYVVIFRRAALNVNTTNLLQNLALYPNPTEGKFTVISDAARSVSHLDVVVSTITGQEVLRRSFDNVGMHFNNSFDISNQAKGVYFVEIRADGEKITKKLIVR